jgi:hypothetical protein
MGVVDGSCLRLLVLEEDVLVEGGVVMQWLWNHDAVKR